MTSEGKNFNTSLFLRHYERYPCLWNKNDPDFRNKTKRNEAEKELMPLSGFNDVISLRKKIRSIRCTYNQEKAKVRAWINSESGSIKTRTPKLSWFPIADSFLKCLTEEEHALNVTKCKSKPSSELRYHSVPQVLAEEDSRFEITCIETTDELLQQDEGRQSQERDVLHEQTPKTKQRKDDPSVPCWLHEVSTVIGSPEKSPSIPRQETEFDIFGKSIAAQLKNLPLDDALELQLKIQTLITQERLKKIVNQQSIIERSSQPNLNVKKQILSTICNDQDFKI